ncbi:type II toxin-antitoxin system RelE/ParE family toxin [uncultured Bacteroides sp.]|jgi:mRNA-degrading endonuclease RelE of RelBE toxin-antitoxin system|uniref:type II toxin-antitoxin system RelE family toxin n=1 Tax=uncultured Bacteroides sp. TaxID=162156 RepID=UPI00206AB4EE|nr:hypothetical protein [uncultured Bacteroides sp.]DAR49990.1 MAG TPA: Cytotoxic translational repressor [Caudoviricetes sp.]
MKTEYSKAFIKSAMKLSGKIKESLRAALLEVEQAKSIEEITDCKKLIDYKYIYRIRIGNYRAFFIFHVQIKDDVVLFQYLIPRGEAYAKKAEKNLREKDK